MGTRRGVRRRRRPSPSAKVEPAASAADDAPPNEPGPIGAGYGKAALLLALLLGTFGERIASDVLPAEALDIFHLVAAIGVAFLVARWYRGFMRRTLGRTRRNRRDAKASREE